MGDNPRIEDLRRRIQADPTSIAFAQLAEEYRRAGQHHQAIDVCRAGLAVHSGYLSARVTLGRALIEIGQLDAALPELQLVLKSAPENLAAIRGVAEIFHRRGALAEALEQYRAALILARNDPDLEETVSDLARQLTPQTGPEPDDGLTFEQIRQQLAVSYQPPPARPARLAPTAPLSRRQPTPGPPAEALQPAETIGPPPAPAVPAPPTPSPASLAPDALHADTETDPARDRALLTLTVLGQWLAAIHVARADQHP